MEDEYQLIKNAKCGDSGSFGLLYDRYTAQIYRFILLKVSHKEIAEDLTHEVFLSAWQNIDNYHFQGHPFSTWLYQIARNRVIDHYRTQKINFSLETVQEDFFQVDQSFDRLLDQQISLNQIKTALKQLTEEQQNIVILRFVEDLSPSEISQILHKSEGAVRLMQHRAIQKLKEIIEKNGATA